MVETTGAFRGEWPHAAVFGRPMVESLSDSLIITGFEISQGIDLDILIASSADAVD